MVYLSMQEKVDLVAKDYYDQELSFQNKIDASKNNAETGIGWKINVENEEIVISYPDTLLANNIKGDILFFRPSNSDNDVKEVLKLDAGGKQRFPKSNFITGAYIIKINWVMNGKNYFDQRNFYLN